MTANNAAIRWCAVYTRKSSEEGLEQQFNSLHAQREAGEAFIKSQRHEGWRLLAENYDDGGCSGGNLERPALKRLVADIRAGQVQTVVVYKVDRLTRSLKDFAQLIELFEARGVTFVSVTQQFNTTTSMGRLMLNVLLSFAQFEREVTGERIRDKIAAARKKGLWMGGTPPIGYALKDKKLLVDQRQAQVVRHIFRRYAALKSVARLCRELKAESYRTKAFTSSAGRCYGGKLFTRGHLYRILQNRVYLGEVNHKDTTHRGEHAAVVERRLWDEVQGVLAANRRAVSTGSRSGTFSLFKGLVFDDAGNRMSPVHANKAGCRYRYYVSQALLQQRKEDAGSSPRLPAHDFESLVSGRIVEVLGADARMRAALVKVGWNNEDDRRRLLRIIIQRIEVGQGVVRVQLDPAAALADEAAGLHAEPRTVEITCDLVRGAGGVQITTARESGHLSRRPDAALIKGVVRGYQWRHQLLSGEVGSVAELARKAGVNSRYVMRAVRMGFLAPDIIEAILEGRQTAAVSFEIFRQPIPLEWTAQRLMLGFVQ
jgi:DNA invertase Pin-like site-specific DNA recombinase